MHFILKISCIFLFFINFSLVSQVNSMLEVKEFGSNPGDLKMFMHTSTKSVKGKKPLVLVLHGCNQNAEAIEQLTGWNKLSDSLGFDVLYPEQRFLNNPQLCFNWFRIEDQNKDSGECESIHQMLQYSLSTYAINSDSVYITGLSAGAGMAMVLLASYPESFNAGAVFAGPAFQLIQGVNNYLSQGINRNIPSRDSLVARVKNQNKGDTMTYPMLYLFQGESDKVVAPKNAQFIVQQWTGVHDTDDVPDEIDTAFNSTAQLKKTVFLSRQNKPILIYFEIENFGHALLINPGNKINEGGKKGSFGKDRNWHSTYYLAQQFFRSSIE
jgi:poly(hydroxyalkanoate) depolymerase family esterase